MMPLNGLKTESKMRACSGASGSPLGAGIFSTIASSSGGIPSPVRAETLNISSGSQPRRSAIWSATTSGWAESMSILFITGMISSPWSTARYRLEIVWAWMPWDASTTSRAPSQEAMERETS